MDDHHLSVYSFVMNSLKQFIPVLSDLFGNLSDHALYERQRALVRAGLLKAKDGRGPGSGVPLTADNVAMLLLAVLATDNLSEVAKTTKALLGAERVRTPISEKLMPGVSNPHEAMSRALRSSDKADQIKIITVNRVRIGCSVRMSEDPTIPLMFLTNKGRGGFFTLESSVLGVIFDEIRDLMSNPDELPSEAQIRLARKRRKRIEQLTELNMKGH